MTEALVAEKNGMWKGDSVTRRPLHQWIKRRLKRPELCQQCEKVPVVLDLANISGLYRRSLDDWIWLCRRCHMLSDGRHKNLKQYAADAPTIEGGIGLTEIISTDNRHDGVSGQELTTDNITIEHSSSLSLGLLIKCWF